MTQCAAELDAPMQINEAKGVAELLIRDSKIHHPTLGVPTRYQTSRGYPRAVNNLALQALVTAFAADKAIVDESSTRTAVAEVTAD